MTEAFESRTAPHLLTIALEDYFQVGAFNRLIQKGEWYRFESRLERNTCRALDLLDECGAHATFFCLGWVADQLPELVRQVAERGHEIASKGYYHRGISQMTPAEFRDDLAQAREALQRASGQRVLGYRVADGWFTPSDLWALDILAERGYEYDSSIGPIGRRWRAEPWRRFTHTHHFGEHTLWEFPISAVECLGEMIPIAGGNWLRQLPPWLVRRAVDHWVRTYTAPYVMYFHVWELDPDIPRISAASWLQRVRTYRHLDRMPALVRSYLERYRFSSVAGYLGLATGAEPPQPVAMARALGGTSRLPREPGRTGATDPGIPVTIVVPCYNEELVIPYLANTLRSVTEALCPEFQVQFLFVDDASSDSTAEALGRTFGSVPGCTVIRHSRNLGVAGAIATGLQEATTEIVCSIDCDCTYDPHTLAAMIPLLGPGVDLVTASPYHPAGAVRNVPAWRLALSRTLSRLYQRVLHHRLYTYTSCFRVYRRSTVLQVPVSDTRFLGVAELLGRLDLMGGRIEEFPASLQVRVMGHSKMKVISTIVGHLGLLARLGSLRLTGRTPALRHESATGAPADPVAHV